ncbi:nuclear transport factor 2 family protein [Pelomyxa schiedti]|nr:nuclear transport factor 2 family protein [Pelomyxa schiedti]
MVHNAAQRRSASTNTATLLLFSLLVACATRSSALAFGGAMAAASSEEQKAIDFNQEDVDSVVTQWYHLLDVHAPVDQLEALLVPEGAFFIFPEANLTTMADFESWYYNVTREYFDEMHVVASTTPTLRETDCPVKVMVHWEASEWFPPEATSHRICDLADQDWIMVNGPTPHNPVIQTYIVNSLVEADCVPICTTDNTWEYVSYGLIGVCAILIVLLLVTVAIAVKFRKTQGYRRVN